MLIKLKHFLYSYLFILLWHMYCVTLAIVMRCFMIFEVGYIWFCFICNVNLNVLCSKVPVLLTRVGSKVFCRRQLTSRQRCVQPLKTSLQNQRVRKRSYWRSWSLESSKRLKVVCVWSICASRYFDVWKCLHVRKNLFSEVFRVWKINTSRKFVCLMNDFLLCFILFVLLRSLMKFCVHS